MWKRIIVFGLIVSLLLCGNTQEAEAGEIRLYAKAAVLMDAESGRVLYEKNGSEILPMASTTKIMTCIVALENADLEEVVSVSAYAASMPKVKMYVKKGERYRLGDLLYSLMLESHNDVAVAIAEHIGKRFLTTQLQAKDVCDYTRDESMQAVAAFADLMNAKAMELGCLNTWFITPNGLDATETFLREGGGTDARVNENGQASEEEGNIQEFTKQHSTTAKELATIMSYCVLHSSKKEVFLEITGTPSYTVTSLDGRNSFCTNHNAFLHMMEGAFSGKTGFTNLAGYCYVGAVKRDGKTYVVALLACGWPNNKGYKWSDTKVLMNYGIEEYAYREFGDAWEALDLPEKVRVRNGQTPYIGQTAYVSVKVVEAPEPSLHMKVLRGVDGGEFPTIEKSDTPFGERQGVLMRADEEVKVNYQMADLLDAPVYKGDIIGVITYEVDGVIYKQEEIVVTADVPEIDWEWCVKQVLQGFF